jgi:hypothetical protein
MQAILDFFYSWLGMGIMAVLLIGLVVLLLVLRNKREDDD